MPRFFSAAAAAAPPEWVAQVGTFFDKMEAGLQMMKASNDHFVMTRQDDGGGDVKFFVDVGEAGMFIFIARPEDQQISVQSPVSGGHAYAYDPDRDWWCDINDDHNILELFSRDVMYVASGYPTF
jgi:frataxin-like iron-binding protein CyaY